MRRTKGLLVAVLCLYAALVAGLMVIDRATFIGKTAAVPAVVIVALLWGRGWAFVRDWTPFLGTVVLFDSFRGLVFSAIVHWDLPYYARYAIDAEHAVLGATTLPQILQRWWLVPGHVGVHDAVFVAAHASHFVFFLLFGLVVWRFRRDLFARFEAGVLLLLGVGLLLYALVPTVPPWMAAAPPLHLIPDVAHVLGPVYANDLLQPLTWTFDLNPIAAMPSLHAAFPAFCAAFALRAFGRRGVWVVLYAAVVCVGVAYLGEHYLVDILAGIVLAAIVDLAVHRVPRVLRPPRAVAEAPGPWESLAAPALMAVLAIVVAELIGQAAVDLRGGAPFHTRGFIARELAGHAERQTVVAGEDAHRRGDAEIPRLAHRPEAGSEWSRRGL